MKVRFSDARQITVMLVLVASAWLWAAVNPNDRGDWVLENLLVWVTLLVLGIGAFRFRFSVGSYWLVTVFLLLHIYGSHYTYAETPLGFRISDWFGWQRNQYDRIVHFAFGLLTTLPFMEYIHHRTGLRGRWLSLFGICVILGWSAFYETMEMVAAVIVHPELGTAFLGTQGDQWDSQKDSALAFLGSLAAIAWLHAGGRKPAWLRTH
jgi:putative membrane protein